MNASLLVLTPSLGRVSLGYRDTFARLMLECARRDVRLSVSDATDPGQLVHARNVLYAAAVASDATHALWWDADVSFPTSAIFDVIDRPEPMICRSYPMRAFDWAELADRVFEKRSEETAIRDVHLRDPQWLKRAAQHWTAQVEFVEGAPVWSADGRLVRVTSCGFGWVLMKVEAMRAFLGLSLEVLPIDWKRRRSVGLFDFVHPGGQTHGEDTSFCWRWKERGGEIWAAPDLWVTNGDHGGCFADYLRENGLDGMMGQARPAEASP